MNDPSFQLRTPVRVKEEGKSNGPRQDSRGKPGSVEGYAGWFGTGPTYPVEAVTHTYLIIMDDEALPIALVNEDWLEQIE